MQLFKNKKHLNTREAEWIEGARRGDRRSQKAIYDLLSAKMFAVCLRYMGDREAAEDIYCWIVHTSSLQLALRALKHT